MYKEELNDEEPKKQFTGWWIPAEVVYLFEDRTITMSEMILLATIDSLVNVKAAIGCFASNKWLANKMGFKNEKTIKNMIANLRSLGLISQISFDGRKRYLETKWSRVRKKKNSNGKVHSTS